MKEVNASTARELLAVVNQGLCSGKGIQVPGKMCGAAAVCYVLGLPHGDKPPCVTDVVRSYQTRLNDSGWSSEAARAKGMRKVLVAQLGSMGVVNDEAFHRIIARETIRVIVPIALREAARVQRNARRAVAFETAAAKCAENPTAAYAAYAAYAAARDRVLTVAADICFDALRECGSPGVALWDEIAGEGPEMIDAIHPMTAAEQEEQRRSFAYGNLKIGNDRIRRATIDEMAEEDERAEELERGDCDD